MVHAIDERLREEARRYRLVFACPECASYDPEGDRCSLGFPHQPHRDAVLDGRDQVVFCKAFEAW